MKQIDYAQMETSRFYNMNRLQYEFFCKRIKQIPQFKNIPDLDCEGIFNFVVKYPIGEIFRIDGKDCLELTRVVIDCWEYRCQLEREERNK
jgi:hypothetical protein